MNLQLLPLPFALLCLVVSLNAASPIIVKISDLEKKEVREAKDVKGTGTTHTDIIELHYQITNRDFNEFKNLTLKVLVFGRPNNFKRVQPEDYQVVQVMEEKDLAIAYNGEIKGKLGTVEIESTSSRDGAMMYRSGLEYAGYYAVVLHEGKEIATEHNSREVRDAYKALQKLAKLPKE